MRSLATLALVGVFVASISRGQPGAPTSAVTYHSACATAAGQLFAQVETLVQTLQGLRLPQTQTLIAQTNALYEETLAFNRLLPRNPPRAQIERDYQRIERRVDEVVELARRAGQTLTNPQLLQHAARIEHADRLLALAIASGGPGPIGPGVVPGIPGNQLLRLARSLDGQSDELLRIARDTLRNDPLTPQIEQQLRAFTRQIDLFRQQAERNADPATLRTLFAPAAQTWSTVVRLLQGYAAFGDATALQQQTIQVDTLVNGVGTLIGGQPLPPGPPTVPGRQRVNFVVGADAGGGPHVRVFQSARRGDFHAFMAYPPDFRGGVRVAAGDVNGDGVVDVITAPGPGYAPLVRVFDGRDMSLLREFLAFDGRYDRGVWIATGDFNGDGRAEIVCGADEGGLPIVRVFEVMTGRKLSEFAAYEAPFRGGVRVAVDDINGDGVVDIITAPGPGRPALVRVFDGRNPANVLSQFDAYALGFLGGAYVSTADLRGNRQSAIVTGAGPTGGPHVRVFEGMRGTLLGEFFPYDQQFLGGVRVACRDVNRDGVPDFVTAPGPGAPSDIRVYDGRTRAVLAEFLAYDPGFLGGAFIASR